MATVRQVCSYFVWQGIMRNRPVTQISLQKLLYFAQGIHLAKHGEPLFSDEIYAWKYGPVVKSIYRDFSIFGNNPMDFESVQKAMGDDFFLEREKLTREELDTLETVWATFGRYSASELVKITHFEDSPWSIALKANGSDVRDVVIQKEGMKVYFKTLMTA